jgi:hypothetical protein
MCVCLQVCGVAARERARNPRRPHRSHCAPPLTALPALPARCPTPSCFEAACTHSDGEVLYSVCQPFAHLSFPQIRPQPACLPRSCLPRFVSAGSPHAFSPAARRPLPRAPACYPKPSEVGCVISAPPLSVALPLRTLLRARARVRVSPY